MKKMLMTTAICGALLGGCATTGPGTSPKLDDIIAQVQAYTQAACGLLPLASSVAEVAAALAGAPGVGVAVSTIGGAICNGFVTRQAAVGGILTVNVNTPRGIVKVKATRVKK